ncbi:MAG: hypothetical protein P8X65_08305 [Syntrophobacterales bacterium]|jgi:hypothetical protein
MKESVLTIFILTLVILVAGSFTLAQKTGKHGPAVPKWAPIPGVSGVEYAPNLAQDLFRYRGGFYNFQGGAWFRGTAATGPWSPVRELPQVFYHIQAPYFKVPPGWAKGKKTGWGGASMPPGQTKKFDQGHIPPGKMKQKGGPKK